MSDFSVLDMPSDLHDLKPLQISQRLVGTLDRRLDRILDVARRRPDQFNDFVDVIRHHMLSPFGPSLQKWRTASPARPFRS